MYRFSDVSALSVCQGRRADLAVSQPGPASAQSLVPIWNEGTEWAAFGIAMARAGGPKLSAWAFLRWCFEYGTPLRLCRHPRGKPRRGAVSCVDFTTDKKIMLFFRHLGWNTAGIQLPNIEW
jgi:hypothetical protein